MTVYNNITFPLTINKYPMPVVNAVLKANVEIERIIENVAFEKFIGVLFNVFNSKGKHSEKEEQVATIFNISLDAAKLLCKVYGSYKQETLETLQGKELQNAVLTASNKKAREILGWKPEKTMDDIISSAWKWHSENPHGYNK